MGKKARKKKSARESDAAYRGGAIPGVFATDSPARLASPVGAADWVVSAVLALLVLAIYAQVRDFDYLNYDDDSYVLIPPTVNSGLSWANARWAFTTGELSNWHPLTWLSFMLDIQIFGLNPHAQHIVNVLFHALNSILLYGLFRKMTGLVGPSAFLAALFAVHPLHVESVAWIAERKDVLSTFFWFLATLAYVGYARRPSIGRYVLLTVLFTLGILTKPMIVTLPATLLLLDYWPLGRLGGAGNFRLPNPNPQTPIPIFRLVSEKIPLFFLATASSIVTFLAQRAGKSVESLEEITLAMRIENAVVSYVRYLWMTIYPLKLGLIYPHSHELLPGWQFIGALVLLAALTVLAVWGWRRVPYGIVGWLWYIGTLIPVIGIVQVGAQAFADRYTYVPLVGIFAILAYGVPEAARRFGIPGKALAAASAVVVLLLAGLAWFQIGFWRDSISIFERTIAVTRDNEIAHCQLAMALKEQGIALNDQETIDEAKEHLETAIRIKPSYALARITLGIVHYERKEYDKAIEHYEAALLNPPGHALFGYALTNLGAAYAAQGRNENAIACYRRAIELDPGLADAHFNLGSMLNAQGRRDEAIECFRAALRINPTHSYALRALEDMGIAPGV